MFDEVKKAFSDFNFLTPKDLLQLAAIARIKRVKKNDLLVNVGDLNYSIYSVLSGLLHHYVMDENGVEKTLRFAPERHPAGSMDTIILDQPASEYVMALENSIVVYFDMRSFEKLASNNLRLLKVQNKTLKDLIKANVMHIKFLSVMTAEERYLSFSKQFPDLQARVKQKYIASYLGITPTSLSRLKARLD
jgi:CRP-like cAMP-binding protein